MKQMENKTYDSKREMEILEALDEIKHLNKRQIQITQNDLLKLINIEKAKNAEKSEEQQIQEFIQHKKVKRIDDDNSLP